MKIWYFHHYATPYHIPGLHRPFEFGSFWKQNGHDVAVFSSSYLHYSGDNMIKGKEKILLDKYDGVDTVFVKTCGYTSKIHRVLNMWQYFRRLKKATKLFAKQKYKPNVIVASSPHLLTMLAGLKIAKKLNVPCICEVRDFWPEVFFLGGLIKEKGLIGRLLLRVERYIYEKADGLVFLKEGDHTYITEHKWDISSGGKVDMNKCAYVNNGVDIKLFDQRIRDFTLEDEDLESDKFKVVYCGTIRPVNNIGMILDVAKNFDDNTQFLIYGDGNCVSELKQRLVDEDITNVKFKGYIENKYVPYVLSKSSINILNYSNAYNWSRGNSSNKLFEYLASSKPVVSTVKMGYDIIERYDCGDSVEECTAKNVVLSINKIKNLDKEKYQQLCINARKAAEHFDVVNLAKDYEKVLLDTKEKFEK